MKKLIVILLILLIATAAVAVYFYREASIVKTDQGEVAADVKELIGRVSRHIVLPEDEVPTLATVSDPDRLKDQPFFANAKKGNQVLLYTVAKKAYLYDPVLDRLLEVAPINISASPSSVIGN